MANLELLTNVIHKGILLDQGMVVDGASHGIAEVAQSLIDRELAKASSAAATHSLALVDGAQKAIAVSHLENGTLPVANSDDARKAQAKADQIAADQTTQNAVNDQANKEASVKTVQPTPADVANAVANV